MARVSQSCRPDRAALTELGLTELPPSPPPSPPPWLPPSPPPSPPSWLPPSPPPWLPSSPPPWHSSSSDDIVSPSSMFFFHAVRAASMRCLWCGTVYVWRTGRPRLLVGGGGGQAVGADLGRLVGGPPGASWQVRHRGYAWGILLNTNSWTPPSPRTPRRRGSTCPPLLGQHRSPYQSYFGPPARCRCRGCASRPDGVQPGHRAGLARTKRKGT